MAVGLSREAFAERPSDSSKRSHVASVSADTAARADRETRPQQRPQVVARATRDRARARKAWARRAAPRVAHAVFTPSNTPSDFVPHQRSHITNHANMTTTGRQRRFAPGAHARHGPSHRIRATVGSMPTTQL
eukprot:355097-Chlamydomonas_euryale.AAC.2